MLSLALSTEAQRQPRREFFIPKKGSGTMTDMRCEKCGVAFDRVLILALAIMAGAKTNDPNVCTDGKEHDWTSEQPAPEQEPK
jgi:hypothetical protein